MKVTQLSLDNYISQSGDRNPIHASNLYARGTRFGTPVVH